MKIAIVGPGIMPIPPTGWGAVEILIWDYYNELKNMGHDVLIINTKNIHDIINQIKNFSPDFVHIQYDEFVDIVPMLNGYDIGITSHYGYLDRLFERRDDYFYGIFQKFVNYHNCKIFCLSDSIKQIYIKGGVKEDRLFVTPNGVRCDLFEFKESPEFPDRSIYLAKIDFRKRQHLFQQYDANIYFAGNIADSRFDSSRQYLGEWSKDVLYKNLTNYANLVLLSDGEAHPLVCMEAMTAGLGLVLSEFATANLDVTKPFISVIPESKMHDVAYVREVIEKNRAVSVPLRNEIRKYAQENFDYPIVVQHFVDTINKIKSTKNVV